MKNLILFMISFAGCFPSFAQKNSFFADVGVPGICGSVTYGHNASRHLYWGGGANIHKYNNFSRPDRLSMAVYGDFRPCLPIKRSMLFSFVDVGLSCITHTKFAGGYLRPFNFYTAVGFGFASRPIAKVIRPYVTIGMYGRGTSQHLNDPTVPANRRDYSVFDATGVASIGVMF